MQDKFRLMLVFSALVFAALLASRVAIIFPAQSARTQGLAGAEAAIIRWDSDSSKGKTNSLLGTSNKPLRFKTNDAERTHSTTDAVANTVRIGENAKVRLRSRCTQLPASVSAQVRQLCSVRNRN